jgi:outer membrane protein TolC
MILRCLVILVFSISFIYCDEKEVDKKVSNEYNLVRCLLTALENNSACKKVSIDRKIAAIQLKASGSSFEWMLAGTTTYTDTNNVSTQSVDVTKDFVTGTGIGAKTVVSNKSGTAIDKGTSLVLNLSQELLAGASIKENNFPIYRAKIKDEQAANKLEDQIRTTLFNVSSYYFNYIKSEETIKINNNALKQAQKFLETVKELKKAGKGTSLDVATAEVKVTTSEEAVLRSQTDISNSFDKLKRSMGLDMGEPIIIVKDVSLDVILPVLEFEKAFLHAIANRPDMINNKLSLDLQSRDMIIKSRGKKPNLKFNYSATFGEEADSFNDAYHYSNKPEHYFSLEFKMHLIRKRKIADYLESKYLTEKSELELWELGQDIKLNIKRIMREIEASTKTIEVQKQRMKTEEIRVQSFETRFENGLIDSLEVTRAYDDLDKARIDLINSKLNLKILVAEYHVAIGSQPSIILDNEKLLLEKQTEKK